MPAQCHRAHDERRLVADGLLTIVAEMDDLPYGGEPVSQLAHALQTATLAVDAGAGDQMVAAALLHDIGYSRRVRMAAPRRSHERASAYYLQSLLGDEVARLVAHHVAAKRYLVAIEQHLPHRSSRPPAGSAWSAKAARLRPRRPLPGRPSPGGPGRFCFALGRPGEDPWRHDAPAGLVSIAAHAAGNGERRPGDGFRGDPSAGQRSQIAPASSSVSQIAD